MPYKAHVNGKVVNIPSFQVQVGDEIEVWDSKKGHLRIASAKDSETREECDWIEVDTKILKGYLNPFQIEQTWVQKLMKIS